MHAFTSAQGLPVGNPVVGPDGTIYGVTQYGGIFAGSIFALTPDGAGGFAYSELHAFRVYDGYQPQAGLILGSDGLLYGTTSGGGVPEGQGFGTVFRFDPASRALTTLHVFSGTDGSWPQAALTEAPDGSFYGTARFGGDDVNMGTVFRLDSAGNFTRLHSFSGTDGRQPMGRLYRTPDGDLYGTTARGASDADDGRHLPDRQPGNVQRRARFHRGADGRERSSIRVVAGFRRTGLRDHRMGRSPALRASRARIICVRGAASRRLPTVGSTARPPATALRRTESSIAREWTEALRRSTISGKTASGHSPGSSWPRTETCMARPATRKPWEAGDPSASIPRVATRFSATSIRRRWAEARAADSSRARRESSWAGSPAARPLPEACPRSIPWAASP